MPNRRLFGWLVGWLVGWLITRSCVLPCFTPPNSATACLPAIQRNSYNTELTEGEQAEEDRPAIKTARELTENDEDNPVPSEFETVNRVVLKKRTLFAKKALAAAEERLAGILRGDPVPRVLDSHDDLMRPFNGAVTGEQVREREAERNRPYIDYSDADMVAQEVRKQEERVAEAREKLDGFLEQAKLPELPKPPHMLDQNLQQLSLIHI